MSSQRKKRTTDETPPEPDATPEATSAAETKPKRRRKAAAESPPEPAPVESPSEPPKRQRRSRKGTVAAAPDPRPLFLKSLAQWLQSRKYQSSVPVEDIDVAEGFDWATKAAEWAADALSLSGLPILGGGFKYDAAALYDAITPFFTLGEYIAWRVDGGQNTVIPVIFADELSTETLKARFDLFVRLAEPLAEFGPRVYASSTASGNVSPLLVYFDAQRHAEHVAQLLAAGSQARTMQRVYVQAGFINVPEQRIIWAEKAGLAGWISGLLKARARSPIQFETAELQTVIALMGR